MKLNITKFAMTLIILTNFMINFTSSAQFQSLFSDETWVKLSSKAFLRNYRKISQAANGTSNQTYSTSNSNSTSMNSTNTTTNSNGTSSTKTSSIVQINFDNLSHQLALFYYSFYAGLSNAGYKVLFNISREWIDCSNNFDFQTEYQKNIFSLRVLDVVDLKTRGLDNNKLQTILSSSLNSLLDTIVKKTYFNPKCDSLKALIDKKFPISSKYLKSWSKVVKSVNGDTVLVKFPSTPISNENKIVDGNIQVNNVPVGSYIRKSITFLVTPYDRVAGFLGNMANAIARKVVI